MYAGVAIIQLKEGKTEEASNIFREFAQPIAKTAKGSKGGLFLTNEDTNEAIAIGLWDTEEDAKRVETMGMISTLRERLASVSVNIGERKIYKVSVKL